MDNLVARSEGSLYEVGEWVAGQLPEASAKLSDVLHLFVGDGVDFGILLAGLLENCFPGDPGDSGEGDVEQTENGQVLLPDILTEHFTGD